MPEGVLRAAFNDRGFTFIEGGEESGARDVFLHIRNLVGGEDADRFVRGARVSFDLVLVQVGGEEKPQARNVRLIEAGPDSPAPPDIVGTNLRGRLKFWHANGYGFVVDESSADEYYVSATSVPRRHLRNGDVVEFDVEKQTDDRVQAANVRVVDWTQIQQPFDDQLDMGHPRWTEQLATLCRARTVELPTDPRVR